MPCVTHVYTLWTHQSTQRRNKRTDLFCYIVPWYPNSTEHIFKFPSTHDMWKGYTTVVIMGSMAYQITSLTIVYSTVYSDADQRKHQISASLAVCGEFTGTGEFPAQMVSNTENVSIWWRHHVHNQSPSMCMSGYCVKFDQHRCINDYLRELFHQQMLSIRLAHECFHVMTHRPRIYNCQQEPFRPQMW